MPVYAEAQQKYKWLAESIEVYWEDNTKSMSFDRLIYFYQRNFLSYMGGLIEVHAQLPELDTHLGSDDFEDQFNLYFAAGPGGLDFLLGATQNLYEFIQSVPDSEKPEDIMGRQVNLQEFCSILLKCVKHLRLKVPRERWDPKIFRKFHREYRLTATILPVGGLPPHHIFTKTNWVLGCDLAGLGEDYIGTLQCLKHQHHRAHC
jgi:hypothetical protein